MKPVSPLCCVTYSPAWRSPSGYSPSSWATCTAGHPNAAVVEATPSVAFIDNGNGTVTHVKTGLMWKQCSEGQGLPGCTGIATSMTWSNALAAAFTANSANFGGHNDWRLPNAKELQSIAETCGYLPAINQSLFPATPGTSVWSASTYVLLPAKAWVVGFDGGTDLASKTDASHVARLVRGGQTFDSFYDILFVNGFDGP